MTLEADQNKLLTAYARSKEQNGGKPPSYRDFLVMSQLNKNDLIRAFGSSPYTKLQKLAGDDANQFCQVKTPLDEIMHNYGNLANDVINQEGKLPAASDWLHKNLRPAESGLNKSHGIRWTEFPAKFTAWCESNPIESAKYGAVLSFLRNHSVPAKKQPITKLTADQSKFETICEIINKWSPALRRNSEEAYKSELSLYLKETFSRDIREERTGSLCDIALGESIGIELKKSPDLAEYDRCFGQTARHLENFEFVAVVIFDVGKQDPFDDFCKLVDTYFKERVRIIKM